MSPAYDLALYIGRFQPFLKEHLESLQRALQLAPHVLLVIAGGRQARSPRNPLDAGQRIALIAAALTAEEQHRITVIRARDDNDLARWSANLRRRLPAQLPCDARIVVLHDNGCMPPAPAPDWAAEVLPQEAGRAEAPLREQLYAAPTPLNELERLNSRLAPGSEALLAQWLSSGEFGERAREWHALQEMRAEWAGSPYTPIFTTVDAVVQCAGHALLIRRGRAPGKDLYALPGGFLEAEDTVLDSAIRELAEETGMDVPEPALRSALKQVRLFDAPWRSQRGRVLTHAHYFDLEQDALPVICAGDDAADAFWVPIDQLAGLEERFHDDHFLILDHFLHVARQEDEPAAPLQ